MATVEIVTRPALAAVARTAGHRKIRSSSYASSGSYGAIWASAPRQPCTEHARVAGRTTSTAPASPRRFEQLPGAAAIPRVVAACSTIPKVRQYRRRSGGRCPRPRLQMPPQKLSSASQLTDHCSQPRPRYGPRRARPLPASRRPARQRQARPNAGAQRITAEAPAVPRRIGRRPTELDPRADGQQT